MNDLRFAFRQLLKNPGFAAVAALTLALGIGANTVVFSVAQAVLRRPLGFEGEARLTWVRLRNTQSGAQEPQLSWREIADIRESTHSFESLGTFGMGTQALEVGAERERVSTLWLTPGLADALRVRPALGRMFTAAEATAGNDSVALVSFEHWESQLGGSTRVLGQTVRLDGKTRAIIGVLPKRTPFPIEKGTRPADRADADERQPKFWVPMLEPRGTDLTSRSSRMFLTAGRLKPGVTEDAARAELATLGQRLAKDHPETNRNWAIDLISFKDQVLGRTRPAIPLLAAAVAAVLVICCVNLANLLLARGLARQRELAVRLALGASRQRLVQTLMFESLLLSCLGGVTGIAFAAGALRVIRHLAEGTVPFIGEASLNGAAVAFTAGLSLITALLFGWLPAWWQSRANAADALRLGTRASGGLQIRSWQQSLLVGQIAIVLGLLAAAGLLLESFRRLVGQDLGYQPASVLTMDLETQDFPTNGETCRMYRALRERLAALPGVAAVGTVSSAPLTGKWPFSERPDVIGRSLPLAERPILAATFVGFDYFQAMGIALTDGRYFRDSELNDDGYGRIVILNQAAAALLFPGRSAVGGRFTVGSNPDRVLEVIGVVKDTRDVRLEEKPQPRFYWQYAFGGAQVVVRGSASEKVLAPMLRAAVAETDRRARIQSIQAMTDIVASTVAERKFLVLMILAYAVVAVIIAAVGIFGVVAYQVAQRTNEFGVRLALGATPKRLLGLVLWQAGRLTLVGLAIGLGVSFATSRLLASQLFGLTPHDPTLLTIVCVLLAVVALTASFLPARRAAQTNPMEALRNDG